MPIARPRFGLIPLVWLVVGVIVAATHHYFEHVDSLRTAGSAILAVLFWPLLLLGIDLHIHR
jgi:carbon starvation protein CstA